MILLHLPPLAKLAIMNNHTVGWKFWQQGGVEWNDHLALYGMAKKVKLLTVHTMAASQEIYLLKLNDIND